jgi:hypothetical protein
VTGTPKSFWIQLSATGYKTTNYYNYPFAEEHTSNGDTYYTYKDESALNLYLDKGAEVQVRVYTSDGVQVEGNLVSVTEDGANHTFVVVDNVPISTSTATSFPATFRLVDERASYPANFTLVQGNHTESQNITILNTTDYYSISFTLPDDSSDQPCSTSADCTASFCVSNFFYELDDCTAGECVYDVESCVICDDSAGCYNEVTTETCYFDSECYDLIECVNSAVLKDARCSSGNVCVTTELTCTYGCEDGICVGVPTDEGCDQSTVNGMLECMSAGVMSFVTSTYDPMFTIMIVLFIAGIVGTVIALAFRGFSRVA